MNHFYFGIKKNVENTVVKCIIIEAGREKKFVKSIRCLAVF